MTDESIRQKYNKLHSEIQKHLFRLEQAFEKLKTLKGLPIAVMDVADLLNKEEGVMLLDQIAYRFSKLQDSLGRLLRAYLTLKGENVEHLPIIDVINLLEKFGFEITPEKWFELREIRNSIAHEYEDEYEKIAWTLNKIYSELPYLKRLFNELQL